MTRAAAKNSARAGPRHALPPRMRKIITTCLVTLSLLSGLTACRTQARVKTAHHEVGAGAGAH
jgi:hypothetical protein